MNENIKSKNVNNNQPINNNNQPINNNNQPINNNNQHVNNNNQPINNNNQPVNNNNQPVNNNPQYTSNLPNYPLYNPHYQAYNPVYNQQYQPQHQLHNQPYHQLPSQPITQIHTQNPMYNNPHIHNSQAIYNEQLYKSFTNSQYINPIKVSHYWNFKDKYRYTINTENHLMHSLNDLPAITYFDGSGIQIWMENGLVHRLNEPSIIYYIPVLCSNRNTKIAEYYNKGNLKKTEITYYDIDKKGWYLQIL